MFAHAIALLVVAFSPQGHSKGPSAAELDAMKKLSNMVGKWEGEGFSMGMDGTRSNFKGGETVQAKLHGKALLVEGLFKYLAPGTPQDGQVGHETLAVIIYDEAAKKYRFQTHLFNGPSGEHTLELIEGGWKWEIKQPNGPIIRFTAKIDGKTWQEIGEVIMEGRPAIKIIEFTLKKVGG